MRKANTSNKSRRVDKPTHIYILYDPSFVSDEFYAGKTWEKNPRKRLTSGHLNPTKLKKDTSNNEWIRSLLSRGIRPEMYIVCVIPPNEDWAIAETSLIRFLRACGVKLTNDTDGGEGRSPGGWHHTPEAIEKMANGHKGQTPWNKGLLGLNSGEDNPFYGRQHTDKTRKTIGDKNKGRKLTPKQKEICASNLSKGRGWNKGTDATTKYLPVMRGKDNPAVKLTEADVLEIRRLRATGQYPLKELSKMFNVTMASISDIANRKTWTHI